MAYKMRRGPKPRFTDLGSSPAKQENKKFDREAKGYKFENLVGKMVKNDIERLSDEI